MPEMDQYTPDEGNVDVSIKFILLLIIIILRRYHSQQEQVLSIAIVNGKFILKDQMKEYSDRGGGLEAYNYLDYFTNTYDGDPCRPPKNPTENRGQKPSVRVQYMEGSGRGEKCRVIRKGKHETKPEFIGAWFPRNDDPDNHELYSAWMLALLVPWRHMSDLCPETQSFSSRFQTFYTNTSKKNKDIMKNIQYYWQCIDGAKRRKEQVDEKQTNIIDVEQTLFEDDNSEPEESYQPVHEYTEDDVERALANEFSQDQRLYASVGMLIADEAGIFKESESDEWKSVARTAEREDAYRHFEWEEAVKAISKRDKGDKGHDIADHSAELNPENLNTHLMDDCDPGVEPWVPTEGRVWPHTNMLNTEQHRAHDIVANQLHAHLNGIPTRQLLMIVVGSGGTGKSTMLNAITKTFEAEGVSHLLFKTALSGVAASLIGGTTLHWWAGLPAKKNPSER